MDIRGSERDSVVSDDVAVTGESCGVSLDVSCDTFVCESGHHWAPS